MIIFQYYCSFCQKIVPDKDVTIDGKHNFCDRRVVKTIYRGSELQSEPTNIINDGQILDKR